MKYLVTADWHLRNDRPRCRLDEDWINTQRKLLTEIVGIANIENASIVIGGDIYNSAIVPARISNLFLSEIRKCNQKVFVLGGNHSLQYHQENLSDDSSIGLLKYVAGNIVYLEAVENREEGRFEHSAQIEPGVYVVHTLCFKTKEDIPFGANATYSKALLEKYTDAKWLFLGDNHTGFTYSSKDRQVINPGTPIIQNASLLEYTPAVYVVDTDTENIQKFTLANDKDFLTVDYLIASQERENRIDSFIETVKKGGKISLSFEDNLREELPKVSLEIQGVIQELFQETVV